MSLKHRRLRINYVLTCKFRRRESSCQQVRVAFSCRRLGKFLRLFYGSLLNRLVLGTFFMMHCLRMSALHHDDLMHLKAVTAHGACRLTGPTARHRWTLKWQDSSQMYCKLKTQLVKLSCHTLVNMRASSPPRWVLCEPLSRARRWVYVACVMVIVS